ncbi:uncharacterized protein BX663DRAFT_556867 [Cokeromyces recurvatus]|uniref:uncharacterized protein n=1 Tax=Cokeromyces recurvatus TaxID=90255 RepID=UPI00221E683C|nr:uncharacterized protein BX663DRAFT_556867 [Cokeromyces recurvatus]KAI7907576.1 hypothetical protein BX663DRAFT_556867 [Cokeromyces recurvatus]
MGLPLYKPKKDSDEVINRKPRKQSLNFTNDELWSAIPHELIQNALNQRHLSFRQSSLNNHSTVPTSSFPFRNNNSRISNRNSHSILSQPHMRIRMTRNNAMARSSSASHVQQLPIAPLSSFTTNQIDEQLQQRINEKESLLAQLRATILLIDQFLLTNGSRQSNLMDSHSFIAEDLPLIIQSASSLVAMIPTVLSSSTDYISNTNEPTTLNEMIDRLLQAPPYCTLINDIENNIISAQRRLREHIRALESFIPSTSSSTSLFT